MQRTVRIAIAALALATSGCATLGMDGWGEGPERWKAIEAALRADDVETAEPLVRVALDRAWYTGSNDYWKQKAIKEHRWIMDSLLEGSRARLAGTLDEEPYCDALGTFNMGTKQGTDWKLPRSIIEFAVERCNGIRRERVAAKKSAVETSWDELTAAITTSDESRVEVLATQLQAGLNTQTAVSRSLKRTVSAARGGKFDTYCHSSEYADKWVAMIPRDAYVKALAGRCEAETAAKARAASAKQAREQRAADDAKARRDAAIAEESDRVGRRVVPGSVSAIMGRLVISGGDQSSYADAAFGCSSKLDDLDLCSRTGGATVLQAIDATTALYSLEMGSRRPNVIVLVRDSIRTSPMVSDQPLPLGLYALDGTFTYDTAIGSTNTVYAIRRID